TPAAHIEDAPSQATPDRQDGASAARDTPTIVIPLLEREERAMRDAQSELQSSQGK
ncbi:aminoglycoside phosphotransferase, partial [Bifidobacterium bifidum]